MSVDKPELPSDFETLYCSPNFFVFLFFFNLSRSSTNIIIVLILFLLLYSPFIFFSHGLVIGRNARICRPEFVQIAIALSQ